MKQQKLKDWCTEKNRLDLLKEWDSRANSAAGFYPDKIGRGSTKSVMWICSKGHSYPASVGNRTKRNDGCPFCSNHRLLTGFNDLATIVPDIVPEWDEIQNKEKHDRDILNGVDSPHPATPSEILWGSTTRVYWKCAQGHTFCRSPNERHTTKTGHFSQCNKCANKSRTTERRKARAKKLNLALLVPQAVMEWVSSEHGLSPNDVSCNSTELVHWRCNKGHEFDKHVNERVSCYKGHYYLHQCNECFKYKRTSVPEQICFYYIKKVFPDAVNTFKEKGYELDIYLPLLNAGIEYDGSYRHKGKIDQENAKDVLAQEDGIRLIRLRPESLADTVCAERITIEETNAGVLEGLISLFKLLSVDPPSMDLERDYNDILELFRERVGKTVAETHLIDEWDYQKNDIDPWKISCKETKISVLWVCPKGHDSYPSSPYNRYVRHTNCPICSNANAIRHNKKTVINLDTGEIFNSISEAEKRYSTGKNTSISACCRGKVHTAYGYRWAYYCQ